MRYHLITSQMATGQSRQFSATDDTDAIRRARQGLQPGERIVYLAEKQWPETFRRVEVGP